MLQNGAFVSATSCPAFAPVRGLSVVATGAGHLTQDGAIRAAIGVKEATRQGSIIAAGMIGSAAAGAAVSFIFGPAEPICAVATVAIGSNFGDMPGQLLFDFYQDELDAFNQLMWH